MSGGDSAGAAAGVRRAFLILGIALFYALLLWLGRNVTLVSGHRALDTVRDAFGRLRVEMVPLSPGHPQAAVQERITVASQLVPAAPASLAAPGPAQAAVPAASSAPEAPMPGFADGPGTVFNLPIAARHIVYLIDVSGSMFTPVDAHEVRSRLDMAVAEVSRSVAALPSGTLFDVIFFGDRPVSLAPAFLPATAEAKAQALRFVGKVPDVGGGTNLVEGLAAALRLGPDTIFLLTDGGANEPDWKLLREVQRLEDAAPTPSRLYAFGLAFPMDPDDSHLLQKLCRQCGGLYQHWDAIGARWR